MHRSSANLKNGVNVFVFVSYFVDSALSGDIIFFVLKMIDFFVVLDFTAFFFVIGIVVVEEVVLAIVVEVISADVVMVVVVVSDAVFQVGRSVVQTMR